MNNAIEIKNLKKDYSPNFILGPIDLNISSGSIVGLIGENGVGKTTLIKLILNIIKKETGSIRIFGKDLEEEESSIKEDIGVVLDKMFFPEILSPTDINLVMKDMYKNWDEELYFRYLDQFKLQKNKTIKNMSKGMQKKLEIATALAHKPKLLILDEATSGLDPVVRNEILDVFFDFVQDENHTILLSTHITSDLEHIADKIIFINDGKIILNEDCNKIIDDYGILKCDIDKFNNISKEDIISYKKNKYNYDILVNDKSKMIKKYKDMVIDKINLDELMVLMIKGEK